MIYKTQKVGRLNLFIKEYSSILDFTADLNTDRLNKQFLTNEQGSSTGESYFTETESFEEAQNLLIKGWTPKAEIISKKVKPGSVANITSSKVSYSTVGYQASVPRYLQGIPTSMVTRTPTPKKQKIVVLNKDIAYSSMWTTEAIEKEGIKALQVIQGLEAQGYRVKLNIVVAMKFTNKEVAICKITVKQPDQPLQLSKIAFPITHPSMLRRMIFRWVEQFEEITEQYYSNYGSPSPEIYKKILKPGEYLFPAKIPENYIDQIK